MTSEGMVKALSSFVVLVIKALTQLNKRKLSSNARALKIDLLEMKAILDDVIVSAERGLEVVGTKKSVNDLSELDLTRLRCELGTQLSRLCRIDVIVRENDIINFDSRLKNDFERLIKWKEGILFSYGAAIQFYSWFGVSDFESSSNEEKVFDLYRFCFLNSEPLQDINVSEIKNNISELKTSLSMLEKNIKEIIPIDEVINFYKIARKNGSTSKTGA